jgi:hypothetical protein
MNIDYKKCSNDTDIGTLEEFDENSNIVYIVYLDNNKVSYFCYDVDTMIELFLNNTDVFRLYTTPHNLGKTLSPNEYLHLRTFVDIYINKNFNPQKFLQHKLFYYNKIYTLYKHPPTSIPSTISVDIYEITPLTYDFLNISDDNKIIILQNPQELKLFHQPPIIKLSPFFTKVKNIPQYTKLVSWFRLDKLNLENLSSNPNSSYYIENNYLEHPDINWNKVCENPNTIVLIEHLYNNNPYDYRIKWDNLSLNKNAIKLLANNYYRINWNNLSLNSSAIDILRFNYDDTNDINWDNLSQNQGATSIIAKELEKNPRNNKVNFEFLSSNPFAIMILEKQEYQSKINWKSLLSNDKTDKLIINELTNFKSKINLDNLSSNTNMRIIDILYDDYIKNNGKLINFDNLSSNPKAIRILEYIYFSDIKNRHLINWNNLSANPNAIKILIDDFETNQGNNINWNNLSSNINALPILQKELQNNPETKRINWDILSSNPLIFS